MQSMHPTLIVPLILSSELGEDSKPTTHAQAAQNGEHSACREENGHKVVFCQKSKLVTGLYSKMLFTSPLKVKVIPLYSKLE